MNLIDTTKTVPTVHFDTQDLDGRHQYSAWQDNMGAVFDLIGTKGKVHKPEFRASLDAYNLGDVLFGLTQAEPELFLRDSKRIARDDMDHLMVQIYLAGEGVVNNDQKIQAGDIMVMDFDQPLSISTTDFSNLSMVLPRDLIPNLAERLSPLHGKKFSSADPMVRFVRDHMKALWRQVPDMTPEQAGSAVEGTIGVLNAWLSRETILSEETTAPVSSAVRKAICRYIDANILEQHTPQSLAREFCISRSQLYRMFEPNGGVARYILERRLRRSHRMLSLSMFDTMNISAICFASGFSSESQFSKAFKKRFSMSPSEARALNQSETATGLGAKTDLSSTTEFPVWIRELDRTF